jgi:hypothetical protein
MQDEESHGAAVCLLRPLTADREGDTAEKKAEGAEGRCELLSEKPSPL